MSTERSRLEAMMQADEENIPNVRQLFRDFHPDLEYLLDHIADLFALFSDNLNPENEQDVASISPDTAHHFSLLRAKETSVVRFDVSNLKPYERNEAKRSPLQRDGFARGGRSPSPHDCQRAVVDVYCLRQRGTALGLRSGERSEN